MNTPVTHVKLAYYRKSGKYYSEGAHDLSSIGTLPGHPPRMWYFYEALEEVASMLNRGIRPGLIDGMDFDVLVTVFTEYGPLSALFVRDEDGYVGRRSKRRDGQ